MGSLAIGDVYDQYMIWPNQPTGNTLMAHWLRRMLHASRASEIKPGVNYRVRRTDSGTFLDIGPQTSGGSGSRMFPFKVYASGANPGDATTDWRTFRVRAGWSASGRVIPGW